MPNKPVELTAHTIRVLPLPGLAWMGRRSPLALGGSNLRDRVKLSITSASKGKNREACLEQKHPTGRCAP